MMVIGIVSAGLFGMYIEKTLNYRRIFLILATVGVLQTIALPALLKFVGYSFEFAIIIVVLQGLVFIPLMPLSFDYGCDVLFPNGEAQITGSLMSTGNFIGFVFVLIL